MLHTYVAVADAPSGTRAYDFGHALLGEHTDVWTHDTARPENGAGAMADSVVITENLARIRKKIVDPGTTAEDTPDKTSFVGSGSTLEYALYPTLTNGHSGGQATTVTVRDVLPMHTDYIPESRPGRPSSTRSRTTPATSASASRGRSTACSRTRGFRRSPTSCRCRVSRLPDRCRTTRPSPRRRTAPKRSAATPNERCRSSPQSVSAWRRWRPEPVVATGDQLEWDLLYTNRDARSISGLDVIDVLPHRGDPQGSVFHGTVSLADRVDVAPGAGETVRYTTSDPASISLDGTAASNQPGGSTLWCAAADLGDPACGSAELADVTAVRIERTGGVAPGQTVRHHVVLRTHGERDGDTYTNRFGLRASNLELAALSNRATVRAVAGSIGDRVWTDSNDDGLQGSDEPGIDGVPIRLSGVDDRGTDVARATRSGPDGEYSFDGLRPGDYVVAFTAPDGRRFTKEHVGTDGTIDSDAGQDGETPAVSIAWERSDEGAKESITRDRTVDAGLLLGDSPSDPEPEPGPDPGTVPGAGTVPGSGSGPGGGSGSTAVPTVAPSPGARGGVQGLAFTGTSGTPLVLGVALLLLALGAAMLGTNRNQRRQR
ncbi:SdrD B-like domain-containing protein [Curtobacterium flaccumfaciens]|nr:SdrD B-like domain-containing protein [Curtobacterium flaccumfaciens]